MDSCIFNDLKYAPFIVSLVSYPSSTLDNLISGTTYKAIEIVNETLSQDVTLIKREFGGIPNIPYLFGSYTVGTGATLTIEPGVVCKFKSNGYMTVDKGLIAEGGPTPDSSIVFTALTDDFYGGDTNADSTASSPNRGYWDGVRFTDQSLDPLCRLDHTIFRFSGPSNTIGAVTTISASPSIQNSVFTENLYAFIARGASNPVVNYCDFYANNYYGIWNKDLAFTINAEYNWWGSNTGPTHSGNPGGTGEVVSDMVDYTPWLTDAFNPLMGDVSLNGKIQAYDASLVLQYKVGLITLTNTQKTVSDVSGNGNISVGDASFILQYVAGLIQVFPAEEMAKMMQYGGTAGTNLVVGEVQAGAGSTVVLPVTLEGTEMMNGLYLDLRFDPDKLAFEEASFGNGSMQSAVNGNPAGQVQIALADIMDLPEGEIIWLRFKLSGDVEAGTVIPLEVNSFIANETDLTSQSQNGLIVVISATALDPDASGLQSFSVYPNPSNGLFNIRFYLERAQNSMRISVYNLAGVEVAELANGALPAGEHELSWEANSLPAGVYILRVEAVDVRAFQRIVLVR
jgi:ABC-type cobalt transport system substrate-binding protein